MNIDTAAILNEQKLLSQSIGVQKNVVPDISQHDMLFDYLVRTVFSSNHSLAVDAYFTGGEDCARKFAALCREHLPYEPKSIMEFACGYGRVARYAKHVLPQTQWVTSDIHQEAVDFITKRFGLECSLSATKPEQWHVNRTFDVVFALSFFSHMPAEAFGPWLEKLLSIAEPGGILIFTTHGQVSLKNMRGQFDERGFFWNTGTDQLDLDTSDYGTSAVSRTFVERVLETISEAELIRFQQAFWWGHQDLYVVRKV